MMSTDQTQEAVERLHHARAVYAEMLTALAPEVRDALEALRELGSAEQSLGAGGCRSSSGSQCSNHPPFRRLP